MCQRRRIGRPPGNGEAEGQRDTIWRIQTNGVREGFNSQPISCFVCVCIQPGSGQIVPMVSRVGRHKASKTSSAQRQVYCSFNQRASSGKLATCYM